LGFDVTGIDWNTGTATISQQQGTEYANTEVKGILKTHAAYRSVPVPPQLLELMSAMLAERRTETGWIDGENLWQGPNGGRLQAHNVDSEIRRIRQVTGIHFTAHYPRHYYGAALISAGVPIPQVSKMMGHKSPAVTMRIYAYAMADDAELGRKAVAEMAAHAS
jgi:integrase